MDQGYPINFTRFFINSGQLYKLQKYKFIYLNIIFYFIKKKEYHKKKSYDITLAKAIFILQIVLQLHNFKVQQKTICLHIVYTFLCGEMLMNKRTPIFVMCTMFTIMWSSFTQCTQLEK